MRIFVWLLRAFVFFALFAFALNNQHEVVVRGFFGLEWPTRLVFVVLLAFALGAALGALAMVPSWWRARRASAPAPAAAPDSQAPALNSVLPTLREAGSEPPTRLGL